MKFFGEAYVPAPFGDWVGREEKAELARDPDHRLPVKALRLGEGRFGTEFTLQTDLDGEERLLSFGVGSVESRDVMLQALMDYLARQDAEPVYLRLKKRGKAYVLVDASEPVPVKPLTPHEERALDRLKATFSTTETGP